MTTTSDPTGIDLSPDGLTPEGAGPLDVAALTQVANQMFRAVPVGQAIEPPVGLPASSHGPLPSVQLIPTETDLRSTPALVAGVTTAPITAGSPRIATPDVMPWEALSPASAPVALDGVPFEVGGFSPQPSPLLLQGSGEPVSQPAAPPSDQLYFLESMGPPRSQPSADPARETPREAAPMQTVDLARIPGFAPEVVPQNVSRPDFFDAATLRKDFPILDQRINGQPLIWLDNAATTQKPRAVIERLERFYTHENSNVHRAAHTLAARATDAYEAARETVRRFLNAGSAREIVWVRGATEGMNLLANTWGRRFLVPGDEIVLTHLEHHSNIVPWQLLCAATGAKLKIAPVDDSGQVLLDAYERLFTPRTKLASLAHVSNALGTILPVAEMIAVAHRFGAKVIVDGAQAVSHMPVDVQALDCDFYVFSGHKVFGPTGVGAVFGKQDLWDSMPPWQGGGNMIADVTFERTAYQPAPMRFEAGTGNIADAVGLGAALDYVMAVGMHNIARYEHELLVYTTRELHTVPGLTIIGTAQEKAGVISLVLDGIRAEDVGKALDSEGIAVRSGHHCAQPALRRFGLEATVRPSLALYNTYEDIDALVAALKRIQAGRR